MKHSSCFGTSLKFHNGRNNGCAFIIIHEQPFPVPHYHDISNLRSAPSVTQNQFCTRATFTSAPYVLTWPVPKTQPSAQMSIWPFSKSLHHFLSCCILIKPSPCTSINWWWIFMGKTRFAYNSWITLEIKFSMLLPQHINLSPQQHLCDSCTICCMLTYCKWHSLLKNKALIYHRFADQGTLFLEHALYLPSCNDTFYFN